MVAGLKQGMQNGSAQGWFYKNIESKLGDGGDIMFWEDKQVGEDNLRNIFPRLYSNLEQQGDKIGEVGMRNVSSWTWKMLQRCWFEQEKDMVDFMISLIK